LYRLCFSVGRSLLEGGERFNMARRASATAGAHAPPSMPVLLSWLPARYRTALPCRSFKRGSGGPGSRGFWVPLAWCRQESIVYLLRREPLIRQLTQNQRLSRTSISTSYNITSQTPRDLGSFRKLPETIAKLTWRTAKTMVVDTSQTSWLTLHQLPNFCKDGN
jgi:hypothetical protein